MSRDLIERLRALLSDADADYAADLEDAEITGERPDLDDRQIELPVEWLREAAAALEAEASEGERRGLERALEELKGLLPREPHQPWNSAYASCLADAAAAIRALIPEAPAREGWQPIETAPKDGTTVDLWHEDFGRQPDFKWGHTDHCCGEAGVYCDSDWHGEEAGWVETRLNERFYTEDAFTHWRPLPSPPQDREVQ